MTLSDFNFDNFFLRFRVPIFILLGGLLLTACGIIFWKTALLGPSTKVEVLNSSTTSPDASQITVEIAGSVEKPGVYKMDTNARVDDILIVAGGLTANADRVWTDKYLNKASKLTDGQKVYIPKVGEQTLGASDKKNGGDQTTSSTFSSQNGGLININDSSLKDLDTLPGIGPTYAQNIIDHRPYSTLEELVSKGAIKQNLFDKIKDKIALY